MKRISVTAMMVLLAIWCAYASVSIGTYEMYLRSEILNGEGTLDVIDEIPGTLVNGIRIYVGYHEGPYSSSMTISQCHPLDGVTPVAFELVQAEGADTQGGDVTIYIAADSNVSGLSSALVRFNTNDGWIREDESGSEEVSVEILSFPGAVPLDDGRSNVKASVVGEQLKLEAVPGEPLGLDTKIVGFCEFSWPKDVKIPAGRYEATITVEIVDGN